MSAAYRCDGCGRLKEGTAPASGSLEACAPLAKLIGDRNTVITYADKAAKGFQADHLCTQCAEHMWLTFKALANLQEDLTLAGKQFL